MSRQFRSDDTSKWKHGFGYYKDKDLNVTSNVNLAAAYANFNTVAAGNTGLTLSGASSFQNGDLVVLVQMIGSNVGKWELNRIKSGAGTTSIVLESDTQNNYTNTGSPSATGAGTWSRPIILEMNQYKHVVLGSGGTLNPPSTWNGENGGVGGFFAKSLTMSGGTITGAAKGYRNGTGQTVASDAGGSGGEGGIGRSGRGGWTGGANSESPSGGGKGESSTEHAGGSNGTGYTGGGGGGGSQSNGGDESAGGGGGGGNYWGGGGGGSGTDGQSGGAGGASTTVGGGYGGHPTSGGANRPGGNSGSDGGTGTSGRGGKGNAGAGCNGGGGGGGADNVYADTELTLIYMGGGGGGGGRYASGPSNGGNGGQGGGIWFIFAETITVTTGSITVNGANGSTSGSRGGGGGGGAAGCILFKCVTGSFGSGLVTANGGTGASSPQGGNGGNGSRGVIHVDYKKSVTGTTSPTLSTRQDDSLKPVNLGGAQLLTEFT